jgi:hypothetical protein
VTDDGRWKVLGTSLRRHTVSIASLAGLRDWEGVAWPTVGFSLCIALQETPDVEAFRAMAAHLVEKDIVLLGVYGPDSEVLHDAFDQATQDAYAGGREVVMTVWGQGGSDADWDDAMFDVIVALSPIDELYDRWERVAILAVGADAAWMSMIERAVRGHLGPPPKEH